MKPSDESVDKPEMLGHMLDVSRLACRLRGVVFQEKGVRLVLAGLMVD
jgi:hypothetical protein